MQRKTIAILFIFYFSFYVLYKCVLIHCALNTMQHNIGSTSIVHQGAIKAL